jgi:hypothetical protein
MNIEDFERRWTTDLGLGIPSSLSSPNRLTSPPKVLSVRFISNAQSSLGRERGVCGIRWMGDPILLNDEFNVILSMLKDDAIV